MLALRKPAARPGVALCEVEHPTSPGPGEVLIAVAAAGICGTDLHIADWTEGYEHMAAGLPVTLGHEFSGTVVAVAPDVGTLAPGDRVAVRPSTVCGSCEACRADRAENCIRRVGIGIGRDGGFAAAVRVPAENCVPIPEGLDITLAALAEPMTVSAQAVAVAGVVPGDHVLVLGPGTIGQGAALWAREAGASRIVVAGRDDAMRLRSTRALGFDETLDVGDSGLAATVGGAVRPFDVVIEATGVPEVVTQALEVLRPGGVLAVCGIHPRPACLDLTPLVRRQQQLRGSYRAPVAMWSVVLDWLRRNAGQAERLISHRLALADALAGFALARERQAAKVLLVP